MSTLELNKKSTQLTHFKSTSSIQKSHHFSPRKKRNNSSNISAILSTGDQYNISDLHSFSSKVRLQTNLPQIQPKKHSQKRSSMLETWLDETLDPTKKQTSNEIAQPKVGADKSGPLSTLRKFELDKKYLKTQNISQEFIDKMYKSLYVYTYGINNTFQTVLKQTKSNGYSGKKILNNFWRAFISLLEGCTSFKTCFQVIEQEHLKNLAQANESLIRKQQHWMNQRTLLEQENAKLVRQINDQKYLLSKITADYKISQATLQLSDKAFNEEVTLRLKFEEKLNSIFSSYEELRVKYSCLIDELNINRDQLLQAKKIEAKLRSELEQTSIKLNESKKIVQRAYEVINERNQQIAIKRQEISQLEEKFIVVKQQKQEEFDSISRMLYKNKSIKLLSEESQAESEYKKVILAEVQKRLVQQDNIIANCRETNQKLYKQLEESGKTISNLQKQLTALKITDKENAEKKQKSSIYAKQKQVENYTLHTRIQYLEKQLSLTKGELTIKNTLLERNSSLIGDLQAVNKKLETLYLFASQEKKNIQEKLEQAIQSSQRYKEQMQGMRMVANIRTALMEEANSKLENEREIHRSKISGMQEVLQTKEQTIKQLHDKQIEDQEIVKACQKQVQDSKKTIEQYRSEIINLREQKVHRDLRISQMDSERVSKQQAIIQMNEQLEVLKKELWQSKQLIAQKEGIVDSTIDQAKAENEQLRQLLSEYRQFRERKVGYIHPMIYQDRIEQINRLYNNIQHLKRKESEMQQKISIIQQDLYEKNVLCQQKHDRIQELQTSLAKKQSELSMMCKKQQESQTIIISLKQQQSKQREQNQQKQQSYEKQLEGLKHFNSKLQQQNFTNKQINSQQFQQIQSLKTQNSDVCLKLKQKEKQINFLQQRINQLQQQQRKNASRERHRTQQICRKTMLTEAQRQKNENYIKQDQALANQTHQKQKKQSRSFKLIQPLSPEISSIISKKVTANKEVQTDKKYSHAHRFQIPTQSNPESINHEKKELNSRQGSQEGFLQSKKITKSIEGHSREHLHKKVQAAEFKKALKFTFMRR